MSKNNSTFHSKAALDSECERYADSIFALFETYRDGKSHPWFNGRYYPAMCDICTDEKVTMFAESYSKTPTLLEYNSTRMLDIMAHDFWFPEKKAEYFRSKSRCKHPIGQCAEQHAANLLLQQVNPALDVKSEIYFSKAIRPSTGEEFDYCDNCKVLFDL